MLWPYTLTLFAAMLLTSRIRGPMWAFAISWLVTVVPITFNLIVFSDLKDFGWQTTRVLITALLSFSVGVILAYLASGIRKTRRRNVQWVAAEGSLEKMLPYAKALWGMGATATVLFILDYILTGGASTTSLAELRENIVVRQSASLPGQLSQLIGWANPVVYFFAIYYRRRLPTLTFLWLLTAGLLHFIPGVLTAGRQAAFQLVVLTILALVLDRRSNPLSKKGAPVLLFGIMGSAAAYMLYIAVARSEVWETRSKEIILMALFKFRLSDWLDALLSNFPTALRSSLVEAIVYFSHTPSLFDTFLTLENGDRFWGGNTFPFLARRLAPLTGISPDAAQDYKVALLDSVQSVGTGWSTAYSGLILDWGYSGLYLSLALLGLLAQTSWLVVRRDAPFPVVMFCALVLLNIVYLPTAIGISDTNILFATLASLAAIAFRIGFPRRVASAKPFAPVPEAAA
jgi:hypothetical protein